MARALGKIEQLRDLVVKVITDTFVLKEEQEVVIVITEVAGMPAVSIEDTYFILPIDEYGHQFVTLIRVESPTEKVRWQHALVGSWKETEYELCRLLLKEILDGR